MFHWHTLIFWMFTYKCQLCTVYTFYFLNPNRISAKARKPWKNCCLSENQNGNHQKKNLLWEKVSILWRDERENCSYFLSTTHHGNLTHELFVLLSPVIWLCIPFPICIFHFLWHNKIDFVMSCNMTVYPNKIDLVMS